VKIIIETVENSELRYATLGDWFYNPADKSYHIHVARFAELEETEGLTYSQQYEWLIALHEIVELYMCLSNGVSQEDVDKFDMGIGNGLQEPGNDTSAPYYEEHQTAMSVEILLAQTNGLSIRDYEEVCNEKAIEIDKLFETITPQGGAGPK
jgi:hypothetical protein